MSTGGDTERVAFVAACMAKGLTPEQTEIALDQLHKKKVPDNVADVQRDLEEAIARAREIRPDITVADLNDLLFGDALRKQKKGEA